MIERAKNIYKKTFKYLNVEHLLILASTITSYVSISAFASLLFVPVGITSSAVGTQLCAITAGIKKYKSIVKKKNKNYDKSVLPEKDKLNTIEVQIFKGLINSYICHDEFVSVNNLFREYNEIEKKILKLLWNTLYKCGW